MGFDIQLVGFWCEESFAIQSLNFRQLLNVSYMSSVACIVVQRACSKAGKRCAANRRKARGLYPGTVGMQGSQSSLKRVACFLVPHLEIMNGWSCSIVTGLCTLETLLKSGSQVHFASNCKTGPQLQALWTLFSSRPGHCSETAVYSRKALHLLARLVKGHHLESSMIVLASIISFSQ